MIEKLLIADKTKCLGKCLIDLNCLMVILGFDTCDLYDKAAKNYLESKPENIGNVYMKKE